MHSHWRKWGPTMSGHYLSLWLPNPSCINLNRRLFWICPTHASFRDLGRMCTLFAVPTVRFSPLSDPPSLSSCCGYLCLGSSVVQASKSTGFSLNFSHPPLPWHLPSGWMLKECETHPVLCHSLPTGAKLTPPLLPCFGYSSVPSGGFILVCFCRVHSCYLSACVAGKRQGSSTFRIGTSKSFLCIKTCALNSQIS